MEQQVPLVLPASEGTHYTFAGVTATIKATKAQTTGKWAMIEYHMPAGFQGPAPHYHKVAEEGFYILEGTVTFLLDGETITASKGSFITVPPMHTHKFSNPSGTPASMLVFITPGGFEEYYEALTALVKTEGFPPKRMEKLTEILQQFDTYAPEAA